MKSMEKQKRILLAIALGLLLTAAGQSFAAGAAYDLRGVWVGNAKGPIFGADGSVTITHQEGDRITGIAEGGNVFGRARLNIRGRVNGNYIYGSMDGNLFQGYVYPDGTIQGALKAVDGDTYRIFLRRNMTQYYPWGAYPYGQW
jgi:hypothetical protein